MIVMMIVRTLPYTWRSNHIDAEKRKNGISNFGFVENSMVLKIVEDDEKPREHCRRGKAAEQFCPEARSQISACDCCD